MLHFAKQAIYAFIKFVTFVESELWGRARRREQNYGLLKLQRWLICATGEKRNFITLFTAHGLALHNRNTPIGEEEKAFTPERLRH